MFKVGDCVLFKNAKYIAVNTNPVTIELDNQMTNIRMVTGATTTEAQKMLSTYQELAKTLKEKEIGGNDMKTYKVGIVPGEVYEVVVDDESTTVKELFEFAGLAIDDSYTIHRNGETISSSAKIENISTDVSFYAKKETFIPHLKSRTTGSHYGNIGEGTEVEGPFGEKLYVGDVVELYDTAYGRNIGKRLICKSPGYPEGFVMSVAGVKFENGSGDDFQIRKVKSYRHLSHDEIVDTIVVKLRQ